MRAGEVANERNRGIVTLARLLRAPMTKKVHLCMCECFLHRLGLQARAQPCTHTSPHACSLVCAKRIIRIDLERERLIVASSQVALDDPKRVLQTFATLPHSVTCLNTMTFNQRFNGHCNTHNTALPL